MNFNLSGLFASNFIITIGITLLLAGLIVYYCNTRFVTLERNLNRQNQVLADFIGNVQTQLQYSGGGGGGGMHIQEPSGPSVNELATNEAINAVEELNIDHSVYSGNLNTSDKIEVSDDSDSESNSDSDSEGDSVGDSESDNDDNNNNRNTHIVDYVANLNKQNNDELSHHELSHDKLNFIENIIGTIPALGEFNNMNNSSIKVISMSSNEISLDDISHLVALQQEQNIHEITEIIDNVEVIDNLEIIDNLETLNIKDLEESSSDDDDDDSDEEEKDTESLISNKKDTESLISNKKDAFEILNISPDQQANTDLNKMSVAALREIIIDRKLASKSDAKKMKKNALLEVLNK